MAPHTWFFIKKCEIPRRFFPFCISRRGNITFGLEEVCMLHGLKRRVSHVGGLQKGAFIA